MNKKPENETYVPPWIPYAMGKVGTKEIAGKDKNNPDIIEFHATTLLKATTDEIPWCSSFVNWAIKKAGLKGTDSAAARSWLNWGIRLEQDAPPYGAIAVLTSFKSSSAAHVGFFMGFSTDKTKVKILGGNQGDKVSIADFFRSHVITYRWPKIASIPQPGRR